MGLLFKKKSQIKPNFFLSFHSLSLIWVGHLVIKGNQIGQTGPAIHKPILTRSEQVVFLCVQCDVTRDDLLLCGSVGVLLLSKASQVLLLWHWEGMLHGARCGGTEMPELTELFTVELEKSCAATLRAYCFWCGFL